ncbi:MAG: Crp/Fnr family transcriptional regulator [Deltaproteobacteria bacterium]|jgi:CRP/FNR family transcriptional regulator|nr:Crp/Fnr family transcriptional regulator [Deltaproteobacteria bacterium]MBW2504375.1 Crp/Fnr family transcriptional regulator [Deltaproteobacteria bacterium]MBW2520582.1 Crp/Fnr family transcriptional regulator [Deltaproteobacteria bacterium]
MDPRALLKNIPLFAGLSDPDLHEIQSICRFREHPRGDLLFSEGEKAHGFFIVLSGKVKVYKLSAEGKERILHVIQPGETFAEAAIFGDGQFPAYAETLQQSKLLFLPKDNFLNLLMNNGRIAVNMIAGLSKFLRQFTHQIEELTFKDVPSRLARYLLEIATDNLAVVTLPISKSQLASNLGTVSETLSRSLRKMSDEDLIRVRGKTVEILDFERLEDLADKCKEA